jgi:hypothetical protein
VPNHLPASLKFTSPAFGSQASLFGGRRRFRWTAAAGCCTCLPDHRNQSLDGILSILFLRAVTLRLDDQYAFGCHAPAGDFF